MSDVADKTDPAMPQQQQVLRRLDKSYAAFFGRVKRGTKAGDYRKFRVWDRTMLLKELSYAAPQTAFYPG